MWLAMQKKRKIKHRLFQIGVTDDNTCSICGDAAETVEHIFIGCTFSSKCFNSLNTSLDIHSKKPNLTIVPKKRWKVCNFKRKVIMSRICSLSYYLAD